MLCREKSLQLKNYLRFYNKSPQETTEKSASVKEMSALKWTMLGFAYNSPGCNKWWIKVRKVYGHIIKTGLRIRFQRNSKPTLSSQIPCSRVFFSLAWDLSASLWYRNQNPMNDPYCGCWDAVQILKFSFLIEVFYQPAVIARWSQNFYSEYHSN